MSIEKILYERSASKCELCDSTGKLKVYAVSPKAGNSAEECALICETCYTQIEDHSRIIPNHWRCLNNSMWSEVPAVKVIAWRMLTKLRAEGWPQDLLDQLYLDDETLAWAKSGTKEDEETIEEIKHIDGNGSVLLDGDTVTLIKDLDVKGAGFTAKRGTAVRNIALVEDNPEHIMARVNGSQIVILTKFVKKS
jgi:protein PhnA